MWSSHDVCDEGLLTIAYSLWHKISTLASLSSKGEGASNLCPPRTRIQPNTRKLSSLSVPAVVPLDCLCSLRLLRMPRRLGSFNMAVDAPRRRVLDSGHTAALFLRARGERDIDGAEAAALRWTREA